MPLATVASTSKLVPAALRASNVGVWQWDVAQNILRCDAACAAIFGLSPSAAKRGVSRQLAVDVIHPDDLPGFGARVARVVSRGGLFVAEYRTRPKLDEVRWILARGRFEIEPVATGRGIVIDITESKLDGHVEDTAFFAPSTPEGEAAVNDPLIRACDRALDLKREAAILGEDVPGLTPAVDLALMVLGRRLAHDVPRSEIEEPGNVVRLPKRRRH